MRSAIDTPKSIVAMEMDTVDLITSSTIANYNDLPTFMPRGYSWLYKINFRLPGWFGSPECLLLIADNASNYNGLKADMAKIVDVIKEL